MTISNNIVINTKLERMKMKIVMIVLSMLSLFFAGCAYVPQQVSITPGIHVINTNTGKGLKITVRVKDERPSKSLGHRGDNYGRGAEITTTQNIEGLVTAEILKGLKKKGFDIAEYKVKHERELIAELRHFEYSTSLGFFTSGVHVNGALKIICKNKENEFERMYRIENEEKVVVTPGAKANERIISEGMSNLLEKLLSDNELLSFLART